MCIRDSPAAAQSAAEHVALTVPATTTGEVPASARLLARQLYEAAGFTLLDTDYAWTRQVEPAA